MRKLRFSFIFSGMMAMILMFLPGLSHAKDSLSITGKGVWIWQFWNANSSNLTTTINKLKSAGITWAVCKMGDSNSPYVVSGKSLYTWAAAYGGVDSVVSIFHNNGIKLFGYQYVRGAPYYYPSITTTNETDVANLILDVKGIDGLLIDAEIEYDNLVNRVEAARSYCDSIRAHHPNSFVGLTAWSRPNSHPTFPWVTFLTHVQVNMPQAYWGARPTTVQNEMNLMNTQFASNTATWIAQGDSAAAKPIMPIGDGYTAKVVQAILQIFAACLKQHTVIPV